MESKIEYVRIIENGMYVKRTNDYDVEYYSAVLDTWIPDQFLLEEMFILGNIDYIFVTKDEVDAFILENESKKR